MFKHILLPTDGSKLSDRAVQRGIEFAKAVKAKVTAVHAVPEFRMIVEEGFISPMSAELRNRFESESQEHAKKMLAKVQKAAKAAGVKCETVALVSDFPYQKIIETAKKKKCGKWACRWTVRNPKFPTSWSSFTRSAARPR